jgi:multidrug efflux pump
LLEAVALVVAVIFVFLRSIRSTLIPFVTIPVSLIGSFFFLYVLGFSIKRADAARRGARHRAVVDDAAS